MAGKDDARISRIAELVFQLRQRCSLKDHYLVDRIKITMADYNCLMEFFDSGSRGMKELSEHLGITPGGVTRVVAGLEEQGLVERRMSPQDRRSIDVFLTPRGKKVIGQIRQASIEMHKDIIDRIEPDARGEVVDSVERLVSAIGEWLEENGKAGG